MFCKSLIVFGLLAAFSVQGMEANQLDAHTVDLRELNDVINQAKELIKNLNDIVSGVLGNALGTLKGLIDTIRAMEKKFRSEGMSAINNALKKGLDFFDSKIEEANNLGIEIAKCTTGKEFDLIVLSMDQTTKLVMCMHEPVTAAINMVNNDLKIVGEITENITNLPAELSKCLVSPNPVTCVTNMVTSLTKLVDELPGQIAEMIDEVFTFVDSLAGTLGGCSSGVSDSINSEVDAVIDEISKCVDELIPKQTFRF